MSAAGGSPNHERYWSIEQAGPLAIVRLGGDFLDLAVDLPMFGDWLDAFERAGTSPDSRALLLLASRDCFSLERCDRFWREIAEQAADGKRRRGTSTELTVAREEYGAMRMVRLVRRIPKPVVAAAQGEIEFPFMGLALACDSRIISDDTVFHNRCHELGMPPAIGLGCMLPHYVGLGRATDLLMRPSEIDGTRALELGIVDEVLPAEDFEEAAIDAARLWTRLSPGVAAATKRLLNVHLADLDEHFRVEMREVETAAARFAAGTPSERIAQRSQPK